MCRCHQICRTFMPISLKCHTNKCLQFRPKMSLTTSHSVLLLSPVFQLINHLFLITILFPLVVVISVSVLENEHNCDGNCIQEMERLIEATPSSTGIGVSPFLYSAEHNFMSQFFSRVCDAYRGVDECMVRCESRSKQVSDLKAAYSGLQFVCKEQREEFFGSLPCLSENESKGVQRCSAQINQSHITTVLFTNSIISREFHSMQLRFSSLCRDLATVVRCMIPVIKESCGEQPANLLLKFIGLEFSSFELLYRQLGFDAPLPASCRALITFALANDRAQKPKTRVLLTKLHNNFYLDDHQNNLNGFPSFSDQWKLINQIIFVVVLHSIRIHYLI